MPSLVLIALTAEQAVDAIHWEHKVNAVNEAGRHELADDDLPQGYARVVIARCLSQQLQALRKFATPGANGAVFLKAAAYYRPPSRSWDSEGLGLATQSDLVAHLTTKRLNAITRPYRYVAPLARLANSEAEQIAKLQHTRYGRGQLGVSDSGEINDTIDALSAINMASAKTALALLAISENGAGVTISNEKKKKILAQGRAAYGDCAGEFAPVSASVASGPDIQIRRPNGQSINSGL